MATGDWPDIPFLQALGDGGLRGVTQVICIHTTESSADAAGEARYAAVRADETSAHYYCDRSGAIWQAVRDSHIAYSALWNGNQRGLHIELCGHADTTDITDPLLQTGARIVARLADKYEIPVRKVTAGQLLAGDRGICGHADITQAFPSDHGTHWDPGSKFPWSHFISLVQSAVEGDEFMALTDAQQQLLLNGAQAAADVKYVLSTWRGPAWPVKTKLDAVLQSVQGQSAQQIIAHIDQMQAQTVQQVVAALTPLLQAGGVSQDELEAALRDVLGSLDDQPPTA
jgi:N-acetyl-anhydromuramyl-L-alanine amidase AmpD